MPYFRMSMPYWKLEYWQESFNLIVNFNFSIWVLLLNMTFYFYPATV